MDLGKIFSKALWRKSISAARAVAELGGEVTICGIDFIDNKYGEGQIPVYMIREGGGMRLYGTCAGLKILADNLVASYGNDLDTLNVDLMTSPQRIRIGEVEQVGAKRFRTIRYLGRQENGGEGSNGNP